MSDRHEINLVVKRRSGLSPARNQNLEDDVQPDKLELHFEIAPKAVSGFTDALLQRANIKSISTMHQRTRRECFYSYNRRIIPTLGVSRVRAKTATDDLIVRCFFTCGPQFWGLSPFQSNYLAEASESHTPPLASCGLTDEASSSEPSSTSSTSRSCLPRP